MSTTTVRMKAAQLYKDWHVIDAADRPLGRVASEAARLIRGKHKPTFEPHLDGGDFVIVVNASRVRLSGNKAQQKRYYRHSGYPGGLKERTFEQMMATFPERVIEQAVWGMLPSGPLGRRMIRHLKVYRGAEHPHQSQVVGTERAQEAREAALAGALEAERNRKPRKLRPLPVPAGLVTATDIVEAEAPAKPPRARKAAEPVVEEAPAAEVAAPETPETPAAEPAAEPEEPKPTRSRRKKEEEPVAAAPAAEAEDEAQAKPARRTRARKTSTTESDAASETEAPKPRRRTRKAAATTEDQPSEAASADQENAS
jgi:large subunit ribosomal protein L13